MHLLNSQKTTFLHLFRRTVLFANSAAGISVFNIILPPRRWFFFVSVCLFVCLFAVLRKKTTQRTFTKLGGKVAWATEEPFDVGGMWWLVGPE